MAKVSFSANLAKDIGYLSRDDKIVMNKDFLLHEAKREAHGMAEGGYAPQTERTDLKMTGKSGFATLRFALMNMRQGGYISEFDEVIGTHLAKILTGGDVAANEEVSESALLELEKEAFLSLCGEQKTLDRIQHMLMKGKPLRN